MQALVTTSRGGWLLHGLQFLALIPLPLFIWTPETQVDFSFATMKMTIATIALVYLVSFVAANQSTATGVTMTSDQAMTSDTNPNQAMTSADQTIPVISAMRGQGTPLTRGRRYCQQQGGRKG